MNKKIKVSVVGATTSPILSQFTGNETNSWQGYDFYVNDPIEKADFWVVIQGSNPGDDLCEVPIGGFLYLSAETSYPLDWFIKSPSRLKFLTQFDRVYTSHFVPLDNVEFAYPFLPWMINSNHGESILGRHQRDVEWLRKLKVPRKNDKISMICSDQQWTSSHKLRFRFAQSLKQHFGSRLDWFGNGINSIDEKWDGLAPYSYTIVLENQAQSGVITEKLTDAYLAYSFPLYWGSNDAASIFGHESFESLNAFDVKGSIEVIEKAIRTPHELRVSALTSAREVVLTDFHFLTRIALICDKLQSEGAWIPESGRKVRLEIPSKLEARFDAGLRDPRRLLGSLVMGGARRFGGIDYSP